MLETTSGKLNLACCVIGALCILFYISASAGYSNTKDDLKNVNWFYSDTVGTLRFGLQGVSVEGMGGGSRTIKYNNNNCGNGFCDTCERSGKGAIALTLLSLFLTIAMTGIAASQAMGQYSPRVQSVNQLLTLLAVLFSIIALGLMNGQCMNKVEDELDTLDFDWGPGASLVLVSLLFLVVAAILQFAASMVAGNEARDQAHATPSSSGPGVPAGTQV